MSERELRDEALTLIIGGHETTATVLAWTFYLLSRHPEVERRLRAHIVEVLGEMIGGALVGTFLGVFLAYGFIGPIATKMNQTYEEDAQFYAIIRDCLVAYLHGHPPAIVVELARGNVPTTLQPSFHDLDQVLGGLPADPLAA